MKNPPGVAGLWWMGLAAYQIRWRNIRILDGKKTADPGNRADVVVCWIVVWLSPYQKRQGLVPDGIKILI